MIRGETWEEWPEIWVIIWVFIYILRYIYYLGIYIVFYSCCYLLLGDEPLVLRSSLLTRAVFTQAESVDKTQEGREQNRTKAAKIQSLWGLGWGSLRFLPGSVSRKGDVWLIRRLRGWMALFPESISCAASQQAQRCLQGCCSPITLLLGDCSCLCEPLLPSQRCWLLGEGKIRAQR